MWEKKAHVDKGWDETVELHVWAGADGKGDLYEDDGISLDYRSGKGALTTCTFKDGALSVGPRVGSFTGMPTTRKMKAVFHKPNTLETERSPSATSALLGQPPSGVRKGGARRGIHI
jgi:alpha-D-xyloside xylohydrolase